jgi:serine/threonine protein kinase
MTPEQRRRVRDLFEAALDRTSAERAGWIDREASDDPVVRDEVQSLIDHESRAGSFLQHPVVDRVPGLLTDDVLAPGAAVGSYTIIREIGRGGMGRVYMASDERLGRTVALKALAPHLTRDEQQRERLRREARAAASLTHPGICTVYALEEIDGELYIATEFVDGRTLREEMRTVKRPASVDVLRTARELADALASAHARGMTHRDLKPENVMRTSDGRLKILDFGLARIDMSSLQVPEAMATAPGMLIGTPAYMAPEQLNGHTVDRRADVFALGVLLYEYASGVHPFEAESPLAMVARVLESEARPLTTRCPQLSIAIVDVIGRCLRKSPLERFQTAAEIVGALGQTHGAESPPTYATWWRVHQLVIIALYIGSAALGWQLKEWLETRTTISLFIALGIGATIGCVLRGHLIFTERMNRSMLAGERRRTARALLTVDIALAAALTVDGLSFVAWPLTSVLTISLALSIALAAAVLEPATTRATFGEQ